MTKKKKKKSSPCLKNKREAKNKLRENETEIFLKKYYYRNLLISLI